MQLKEVLEKTGLTKKALRYYEDAGLFQVERKANGYKDYSEENLKKLESIKKLRDLDFSVEEIKQILKDDEKKQRVITKKINENEQILSRHYRKKEILLALNEGRNIKEMDTRDLEEIRDTPFMYIKNIYKIFGWMNLISFLLIFTYYIFLKEPGIQSIFMLLVFQGVALTLSIGLQNRRKNLKKQGINVLERSPKEMVYQYAANLLTYGIAGAIINESWYFARLYFDMDIFNAIGNILMGLFFLGLALTMVIVSFFEDDEEVFLGFSFGK